VENCQGSLGSWWRPDHDASRDARLPHSIHFDPFPSKDDHNFADPDFSTLKVV
jgi:hypothetical protein